MSEFFFPSDFMIFYNTSKSFQQLSRIMSSVVASSEYLQMFQSRIMKCAGSNYGGGWIIKYWQEGSKLKGIGTRQYWVWVVLIILYELDDAIF